MNAQEPIVLALSETDGVGPMDDAVQAVLTCMSRGHQVIAVVGATARDDRAALMQANALPIHTDQAVHAWVRTEPARRAADALSTALADRGLDAPIVDLGQVGPTVRGPALDAEPRSLAARAIVEMLDQFGLLIVPGGLGRSEDGRPAIIGDGSALLTALFFADRLAVKMIALDCDRAADEPAMSRIGLLAGSSDHTGTGLSRRARLYARRQGLEFRIVNPQLTTLARFDPAEDALDRLAGPQTFRTALAIPPAARQTRPMRLARAESA